MTDITVVKLSPAEIRQRLEVEAKNYTQGHEWQPWEDQLIRDFNGRVPRYRVAKMLQLSLSQVEHRAELLGLRRNKKDTPLVHVQPKHTTKPRQKA